MTTPTIVQSHINENVLTSVNPHVPVTPEDVARDAMACAKLGAAMVHFHARKKDESQAPDDVEFYREAARGFLAESDVLWFPPQGFAPTPQERWRHVGPLVEDPEARLEVITIDPGSIDMMIHDEESGGFRGSSIVEDLAGSSTTEEVPPLQHWLWFCEEAKRLGIKPIFGILEPGYLRRVLQWVDAGLVDQPVGLHFILTDVLGFGPPADVESVQSYLRMIPSDVDAEWFVTPYGCTRESELRLRAFAITSGGHVRAGAGTPPVDGYVDGRARTNEELIEQTVELIDRLGGRPATVDETRDLLGMAKPSPRETAASAAS